MGTILTQPAARYFPLGSGRYEVAPGLKPLGTSFGNGEADRRVFQIDSEFARYRRNKLACRAERLDKYFRTSGYESPAAAAAARFLARRFSEEYPDLFVFRENAGASSELHCALTGERLEFGPEMELLDVAAPQPVAPPYADSFDALCSQVQEDIAVVRASPERGDWLAAIHLCSPSHWSPAEKIGRCFAAIHAPVPGIESVNRASGALVEAMVRRGPYVRFVWGIDTENRLNRHPEPPPGIPVEEGRGRPFDPGGEGPPFFLRVERQVIRGLPEVGASIFTIHVSFIDGREIRRDRRERALLRSALLSMSPESRVYKRVAGYLEELLDWLDAG